MWGDKIIVVGGHVKVGHRVCGGGKGGGSKFSRGGGGGGVVDEI